MAYTHIRGWPKWSFRELASLQHSYSECFQPNSSEQGVRTSIVDKTPKIITDSGPQCKWQHSWPEWCLLRHNMGMSQMGSDLIFLVTWRISVNCSSNWRLVKAAGWAFSWFGDSFSEHLFTTNDFDFILGLVTLPHQLFKLENHVPQPLLQFHSLSWVISVLHNWV